MSPVVAVTDDGNTTTKFLAQQEHQGGFFSCVPVGLPLPCQLCPTSCPCPGKDKALKCSFLLAVCVMTYYFMGWEAVPHVIVFSYMLWSVARMIATAFGALTASNEDDKNDSGGFPLLSIFKCPFKAYSFFLFVCFITYNVMGGDITHTSWRTRVAYVSCCLEAFGLISLHHKVGVRGHVRGLSGMSMVMFSLTYTMREFEAFVIASVKWTNLDDIYLEILQISSMLLSYMVLYCVFKTYRASYEADLDVLRVKYLIPGCLLIALVMHPEFRRGSMYSTSWAASFYIDVLALLPQVVMMQRGDGIVEAPIAHFVAATFVSRAFDLLFWYDRWHRGDLLKYLHDEAFSGGLIAFFHIVSFVLVADFMYYYFKWRISGTETTDDHIEISEVTQVST